MDEDIINKFSNKQPKRKKIGKASKSLRNTWFYFKYVIILRFYFSL